MHPAKVTGRLAPDSRVSRASAGGTLSHASALGAFDSPPDTLPPRPYGVKIAKIVTLQCIVSTHAFPTSRAVRVCEVRVMEHAKVTVVSGLVFATSAPGGIPSAETFRQRRCRCSIGFYKSSILRGSVGGEGGGGESSGGESSGRHEIGVETSGRWVIEKV